MEYISGQANQKTRKPLSKAGYGSKRSAFFHLVRVHNGMGPSLVFEAELRTLWKGFTRQTIQRKLRAPRNQTDVESDIEVENDEEEDNDGGDSEIEAEDDADRDEFKQGKEPMSPELFRKVGS